MITIFDMNSGTDEFDFPSEWFMYLLNALCAEMANDNEVDEVRIKNGQATAAASSAMVLRLFITDSAGANPTLLDEQAMQLEYVQLPRRERT